MSTSRTILHVDMDAFFASVEQRDFPELRGQPVLVGGSSGRGVVTAASYEARVFGCRSAMPMSQALRLCPHAIVQKGRYDAYRQASHAVMAILERFTPLVQPISVDEAFLDCTGSVRLHGTGPTIAQKIRADIASEVRLTASVGVAPNKFLAKLASDLNKPDALTVIDESNLESILPPLSVGRLWGVGGKTLERLHGLNIKTIADLRRQDDRFFDRLFGSYGARMRELIHGIDSRDVTPDHDAKSIGQEQTFHTDTADLDFLRDELLEQCESVAARLRRHGLLAAGVSLKIRYGDFRTITRRTTISPSDLTLEIHRAARSVFDRWASDSLAPLRLLGVQAYPLTRHQQLELFDQASHERQSKVDHTIDQINQKLGRQTIQRGKASRKAERGSSQ